MKYWSLVAIILASPTIAIAGAPSKEKMEHCTGLSNNAKGIMEARQKGVPMAKLMTIDSKDKAYNDILAEMVKGAFKVSKYTTDSYQKQAAQDFADQWFAACIE